MQRLLPLLTNKRGAARLAILAGALLLLAACGRGAALAPELIDSDAVTARAFGNNQCYITLETAVPAYLNPGLEEIPVGEAVPGESEAVQVLTLTDDSLWYQLTDGIWIRFDPAVASTRGDCEPSLP